MPAQGSQLVNTDYITNLTNSINAAGSCAELQVLVNQAFSSLGSIKAGINAELASLAPILALLTLPSASPGAIVSWLTGFVTNVLTPQLKPTITYAAQLTALGAQIASLTAAINTAMARIPSCSISIPAI